MGSKSKKSNIAIVILEHKPKIISHFGAQKIFLSKKTDQFSVIQKSGGH